MTLYCNFFSGPGAGKSTICAAVFAQLKLLGYNVEMATEFAKDLVWSQRTYELSNQIYLFGKQHHKLWRLHGKVDVVLTDSPLPLCVYYSGSERHEPFAQLVMQEFEWMDNLNFWVAREKAYNPAGRTQTEDEARKIDDGLIMLLSEYRIGTVGVQCNPEGIQKTVTAIQNCLTPSFKFTTPKDLIPDLSEKRP
jgi:hypothetical protein